MVGKLEVRGGDPRLEEILLTPWAILSFQETLSPVSVRANSTCLRYRIWLLSVQVQSSQNEQHRAL